MPVCLSWRPRTDEPQAAARTHAHTRRASASASLEEERSLQIEIKVSTFSPNARVCSAAAAASMRYDQLTLIPPSDGYHCGICTQRFCVASAWVFRVSKCYRLIFTPHAADRHKRQSFELQIGRDQGLAEEDRLPWQMPAICLNALDRLVTDVKASVERVLSVT
ncbi:hypothetical protein QQF64_032446 [Cirrhinus molitorella]|uniref:Uncharacterized protein n=1 Tax=Cirrhinus molitorella TaxID=172907 RepID=A0ABR3MZT3_9TELE